MADIEDRNAATAVRKQSAAERQAAAARAFGPRQREDCDFPRFDRSRNGFSVRTMKARHDVSFTFHTNRRSALEVGSFCEDLLGAWPRHAIVVPIEHGDLAKACRARMRDVEEDDSEGLVEDWDRVFRPGVEFRGYPVTKWEHAFQLAQQLRAEYNAYRDSLGVESSTELSANRREATIRARIEHEPPVERWSLLLGDALSNYRGALDGLAWELAHMEGRKVATEHQRSLYFPLAATEAKWNSMQTTTLASMPKVILARLETVQPFHFEPVEEGIGLYLNQMNNLDKHRAALGVELRVVDKVTYAIHVKPEDPNSRSDFELQFVAPDRPVVDGDELFVLQEAEPVRSLTVPKLPLVLCVGVNGKRHNVFHLLDLIERQVAATFIAACVGFPSAEWLAFIAQDGTPRPTAPWCPHVARYTREMREAIGGPPE